MKAVHQVEFTTSYMGLTCRIVLVWPHETQIGGGPSWDELLPEEREKVREAADRAMDALLAARDRYEREGK